MIGQRFVAGLTLALALAWGLAAQAASRDELRHFLEVTGFDVAITSMQQGAIDGPGLAGDAPSDFGAAWVALAKRVFDPELMLGRTVDMMQAIMPDALVRHGVDFYASDLGKRLVEAENQSHLTADDTRHSEGQAIVDRLTADDPARLDDYRAMADAIGGVDASVKAVLEIQYRYLSAAMAAGVAQFDFGSDELRAILAQQAPELKRTIAQYSLMGSAYAYRDFTDDEVHAYRKALEDPDMKQVYEILNAIQYEIMAERYETLAGELAKMAPQQDI